MLDLGQITVVRMMGRDEARWGYEKDRDVYFYLERKPKIDVGSANKVVS